MYTSYQDPATSAPAAEPPTAASVPAVTLSTNLNVDSVAPLPPRQSHTHPHAPTSSPAAATVHQPQQQASPSDGHQQQQQQPGWNALDGMKDMHLSGSEPRIYPGMISRRQRTDSLRKSSMHEGDDRGASATGTPKRGLSGTEGAVEEGDRESE